jgi:hypothetical protein
MKAERRASWIFLITWINAERRKYPSVNPVMQLSIGQRVKRDAKKFLHEMAEK